MKYRSIRVKCGVKKLHIIILRQTLLRIVTINLEKGEETSRRKPKTTTYHEDGSANLGVSICWRQRRRSANRITTLVNSLIKENDILGIKIRIHQRKHGRTRRSDFFAAAMICALEKGLSLLNVAKTFSEISEKSILSYS